MSAFYAFVGKYFDNYAIVIILICFMSIIVSAALNIVRRKQADEKKKRNQYCKQLYKKIGDDKDKLSKAIYEYYRDSNYNPIKSFFSSLFVVLINVFMIVVVVSSFNPISNMTDISKKEVQLVVDIYSQEYDAKYYQEMSVLSNLDNIDELLLENGVSSNTVLKLNELCNKLSIGSFKAFYIPSFETRETLITLPIITLALGLIRLFSVLTKQIKLLKKQPLQSAKISVLICCLSIFTFAVSSIVVFYAPIIVCLYFCLHSLYSLFQQGLSYCKKRKYIVKEAI